MVQMRALGKLADRLVSLVVPHTVARAGDCGWECCGTNRARNCCNYVGGLRKCGACVVYSDC
jgi:hypothetical protein